MTDKRRKTDRCRKAENEKRQNKERQITNDSRWKAD